MKYRMLKKLKKNDKGVVFVTVLMIIMVMMILSISIISLNVSQLLTTEKEVRRIQAEVLALGAFAYTLADQQNAAPSNPISLSHSIDGLWFSVTTMVDPAGGGIFSTDITTVTVDFP